MIKDENLLTIPRARDEATQFMAKVAEKLKKTFRIDFMPFIREYNETFPKEFDWRDHLNLNVKDQGGRNNGLAFAFSAIGLLEAVEQINTGNVVTLSEQHLIDCSGVKIKNTDDLIWLGSVERALMLVKDRGYFHNDTYPYTGKITAQCDKNKTPIPFRYIKRFMFGMDSTKDMKVALRYGPLISYVRPFKSFWEYGCADKVYSKKESPFLYPVLVVGYNDTDSEPYWIIKNSMGTAWGCGGYLNLSQKKKKNFGINFEFYFIKHEKKIENWNDGYRVKRQSTQMNKITRPIW